MIEFQLNLNDLQVSMDVDIVVLDVIVLSSLLMMDLTKKSHY
eukprot:CAMPEP_0201590112 /NCGR_PEP_ID=MMETSP0190_2-20130828/174262_1 /ASSEMBLY_ACC=CAM_ASM_000263 /TAXON_ID=37353 /ORGANISM="Rosalina sp." /LENGTH=41 /DNA_ID= /DNA_START= /DNA_END= /DNA_ORIENTATION=